MNVDEFETFDAAYVFGSLSERDRRSFETHLRTCDACSARVTESQESTRLLGLVPRSAFETSNAHTETGESAANGGPAVGVVGAIGRPMVHRVPETLLPLLLRATRRDRNRRRLIGFTGAAAAACIVALLTVVLTPRATDPQQPPPQATAMASLAGVPIEARAQIITTDTWAQVNVWCTYRAGVPAPGNYQAVARTKTGQTVLVGTWPAVPGQTAVIRTPTHLHTVDLASIDILSSDGKTLSHLAL